MTSRPLHILYIAYPLLPVSEDSAGGAEQMLVVLEREMARRGHPTAVAACRGSRITGELIATGAAPAEPDNFSERNSLHTARILEVVPQKQLTRDRFDLVHDMSATFWPHAGALDVPVLATLHLPRSFYPPEMFQNLPANVAFNSVSHAQSRSFRDLPRMLDVVPNGIEFEHFKFHNNRGHLPSVEERTHSPRRESRAKQKDGYFLWLGRICEEKGPHLAIQAARCAAMPLVLAGAIYPFSYHQEFFLREILPHLDSSHADPADHIDQPGVRRPDGSPKHCRVSFVESPARQQKLTLLRNARAVLIPSLAEETSSLVAMEAAACGTPVIAFRRGGIPEVVVDGVTGFLVDSVEEMAAALGRIDEIDGAMCQRHAQTYYSSATMADRYQKIYQQLISETSNRAA